MIRGLVTDIYQKPVSGAQVLVDQRVFAPESVLSRQEGKPRWSSQTDSTGYFEFRNMPAGQFVVSALNDANHAMSMVTLDKGGAAGEVFLTLVSTVSLSGKVVDADGAAVAGAWVYPMISSERVANDNPYRYLPAKTDQTGQFRLGHLGPGTWQLFAVAKGYAPALSDSLIPSQGEVVLTLDAGVPLRGTVREAGSGALTRSVAVTAVEVSLGVERYRTTTDVAGEFVFKGLRPADYRIALASPRYVIADGPLTVSVGREAEPEGEGVPVKVEAAGNIRGRVLNSQPEGIGVYGMHVSAVLEGDPSQAAEAATDHGGYYRFRGLGAGVYRVTLLPSEGFVPLGLYTSSVTVELGAQSAGPGFVARKAVMVKGLVQDGGGQPVPDANVFVGGTAGQDVRMSTRSGRDGAFAIDGLGPDEQVRIWAERLGEKSGEFGPVAVGESGIRGLALTLSTVNRGSIAGRVVNPQGKGMGRMPVWCFTSEKGEERATGQQWQAETDAQGEFAFPGLTPGLYRLMTGHDLINPVKESEQTVTLDPNESAKGLQLVLP
jgi:protocatechuate 3,4-dioxygenase beta subunit